MISRRDQCVLLVLMVLALTVSWYLTPAIDMSKRLPAKTFKNLMPKQFGDWQLVSRRTISIDLYKKTDGERTTDNPYDDTFIQNYRNDKGQVIELAIAYGGLQRQEVKIHRPDLCYYAQGYEIESAEPSRLSLKTSGRSINSHHMQVRKGQDQQIVSYWIRIGDLFSQSAWQTRLYLIQQGLLGEVPDGVLVRVSSALPINGANTGAIAARHHAFINQLMSAVHQTPIEPLLLGGKLVDKKLSI